MEAIREKNEEVSKLEKEVEKLEKKKSQQKRSW